MTKSECTRIARSEHGWSLSVERRATLKFRALNSDIGLIYSALSGGTLASEEAEYVTAMLAWRV